MIHNYFTLKEKQYKISNFLINNQNPNTIDLSIKKKISKLNEYQHFSLFSDFFISKPLNQILKEELDHFVEVLKKTNNEIDDYFPRSNFNTSESNTDYFLVFNYKKGVSHLVNHYLNTKEYPKQTLITKLLFLKEKIQFSFIQPLTIIKPTFEYYVSNKDNINNDNIIFIRDLMDELVQIEERYLDYINKIDNKINSFSTAKTGNYLITVDDEILIKVYNGLEKNDFIDIHKTSLEQFVEVLKSDWGKHKSIIYLNMDNIQFKYFVKCLDEYFKIGFQLTHIEYSGNIENKNGKIKAKSVYTSVSKSGMEPKDFELIKSIFEES